VKFITITVDSIRIWDGVTGRIEQSYDGRRVCNGADITAACLDDRGRKLVIGDSMGKLMVVNLKNGSVMKQLDPHASQICDVVYCMKERAVLSSAWDGQVRFGMCLPCLRPRCCVERSSVQRCMLIRLLVCEQLHVCEEGSLEGYSPNHDDVDGEALVSTLQRKCVDCRPHPSVV
jgi:hypothetical protein